MNEEKETKETPEVDKAEEEEEKIEETKAEEAPLEEKTPLATEEEQKPAQAAIQASAEGEGETKPAPEANPVASHKADDIDGEYNGKGEDASNSNDFFHKINYSNDGTRTIDEQMEALRSQYADKLGQTKIIDVISIVMMIAAFAAVILVLFLGRSSMPNWVTWVIFGAAVVVIIAAFILSAAFNKKSAKVAKEYLGAYEELLNGYVLSDLNVEDPSICIEAKIPDKSIIEAHYFRTITKIESRAIVEGRRNSYNFLLGEVAVVIPPVKIEDCNKKPEDRLNLDGTTYIPAPVENTTTGTVEVPARDMTLVDIKINTEANEKEAKKKEKDLAKASENQSDEVSSGLFGKYYAYDRAVKSEESVIITVMGVKQYTVLPDNTAGFKALYIPGLKSNIVVYAADPKKAAKFFDQKGVELLNALQTNITVQCLFISLNSYGSKLGITLSDDVMQLPMKKLASLGAFDAYKEATDKAFAFIDYATDKSALGE